MTDQPRAYSTVSVLVPTFNEQDYIAACLDSLLSGGFPEEKLEILVIDGGSTDQTRNIVDRYASLHPAIRLLANPKKIVPAALNLAAKEARGEILVWVGAHANYGAGYIIHSVSLLVETGAASVGGRLTAIGEGLMGEAIACALSLPTGTGNARYRSSSEAGWVDTVFGGCWWKEDFLAIGGFDERWVVNQDTEFNYRLRQQVGGIYFSPKITCEYFVRNSISKLARQYWRYGIWRARTFLRHPGSVRLRQLLPPLFVTALILALVATLWSPLPIMALLVIYSAALILVLFTAKNATILTRLLAFICTAVLHTCWGLGFLVGLISGPPAQSES